MALNVGDILKVVATMVWLDGNLAQNVFAAAITGTGGPYDEADVLDDMVDWLDDMYAEIVTVMSDELDGSQCQVYVYDGVDEDFDEVGTASWGFNPTASFEQLPRAVAALINSQTSDPDVQGKKYLPGFTEAHCEDGLWNVSTIVALANFGAIWLAPFVGSASTADFGPGIWSPTNLLLYDAQGDYIIPTIPAYQRRRKRGIGV